MSKKLMFWALAAIWATGAVAHAQSTGYERIPPPIAQDGPPPVTSERPPTGLSQWITYQRDNCCTGEIGADPPIGTELFLRIGPSLPVGGQYLSHISDVGWTIQGGGRALFFNQPREAAWFIEMSLSNTHNQSEKVESISIPRAALTPRAIQFYNRTFVNLGLGREWYFYPATETTRNWRMGLDGGARYGSASLGIYNDKHITDVVGGLYAAWHTDIEWPFCCCHNDCIFQAGFRVEYGVTWSDIMGTQGRTSNMQDVNFLVNVGVRY